MVKAHSAWRSPWVIGFAVMGVIFVAANVYLIWIAGARPASMVVEDYYERGQDYEKNMLKRMAKDPGWEMALTAPEKIVMNKAVEFRFELVDKEGRVVTPDSVTLYAYRPSDSGADFSAPMQRLNAGNYRAELSFPLKGVWDLLASVKRGEDEFNVSRRVNVSVN